MAKAAILADANTALGFSLVGADLYVVKQAPELEQFWNDIKKQNYAVIFITEELYQKKQEEIEKFNQTSITAVSLIPSASGSKNLAKPRLRTLIKKAVGKEM